jgi:hypothetical protein
LFNVAAFTLAFAALVFGTRLSGLIGLLMPVLLLVLVFSGLRPSEAKAPFRPREWLIWLGGFAFIPIAALTVAAALRINFEPLSIVGICALSWACGFLTIRDTFLAARGSKGPSGG